MVYKDDECDTVENCQKCGRKLGTVYILVRDGELNALCYICFNASNRRSNTMFKLIDGWGRTVAVGDFGLTVRMLKHHVEDGDYAIEGPDTDATFYRIGGVVYPSGGVIDGLRVTPRSKEECVEAFGV